MRRELTRPPTRRLIDHVISISFFFETSSPYDHFSCAFSLCFRNRASKTSNLELALCNSIEISKSFFLCFSKKKKIPHAHLTRL
jgi:hypothetical protein